MNNQQHIIFGIDLGTTYSCIAYVDTTGRAIVIPNQEHQLTTPSVVLFEDETRIVGEEAKNSMILNPENTVVMIKRRMGEANWRFHYEGKDYPPEEISSYILRKLAHDAEVALGREVKDVVITCPAYFGIAQREATAQAGEIAGLHVHEIISEPTAAAVAYGLQHGRDKVVLVYDLGGGTFDIAIIAIKKDSTTVITTGGDHHLGGRDWDEAIVTYLAQQWKEQTGSSDDPLDAPDTLQDFWIKAETAKRALTVRNKTSVAVSHAGKLVKVILTCEKFEELTASLLERTMVFTNITMNSACKRGYTKFDQIVLVGGSTRMPQIAQRLEQELHLPLRLFEPDEAIAKGAALYGQKLFLQQKMHSKTAQIQRAEVPFPARGQEAVEVSEENYNTLAIAEVVEVPGEILEQTRSIIVSELNIENETSQQLITSSITNVASHSFGIIAVTDYGTPRSRKVISNLVKANDPLPIIQTKIYGTIEANQDTVVLEIMENVEETWIVEPEKYTSEAEIGVAILNLPPGLPEDAPIEITFEMNTQGRLHVTAKEPDSQVTINTTFEAKGVMNKQEKQQAILRSQDIKIV